MTTKVKITNESVSDSGDNHVVQIASKTNAVAKELKPGESFEGYVHDGEAFTVSEAMKAAE